VRLYSIFPHNLINGKIIRKKIFMNIKVFQFSLQHFSEIFLILRIQRDIIINVHTSSYKVPGIFVRFELKFNFLHRLSKNTAISRKSVLWESSRDTTKLIMAFHNFRDAAKNCCKITKLKQKRQIKKKIQIETA
jgi:hypothetical protein